LGESALFIRTSPTKENFLKSFQRVDLPPSHPLVLTQMW
jgi:hypothetical protein